MNSAEDLTALVWAEQGIEKLIIYDPYFFVRVDIRGCGRISRPTPLAGGYNNNVVLIIVGSRVLKRH